MPKDPHITGGIRHDWTAIKHEYVTDPKASLRKLSAKYGVSYRTIANKSKAENWFATRKQSISRVVSKAISATEDEQAKRLAEEADYLKRLSGFMDRMLNDDDQFNRHLVESKEFNKDGGMNIYTKETLFKKVDTRSMRDSFQMLKYMDDLTKSLYEMQKADTLIKQQLDREKFEFEKEMARERLKLEQERIALERERNALRSGNIADVDATKYGVVLIPEVKADER